MHGTITKLTGVTIGDAQENIKKLGCKDILTYELLREPDNLHDPNAIRVVIGPYYMGYIPRGVSKKLAPLMDAGQRFIAENYQRNESPIHDTVGLTVRIIEEI